MLLGYKAIVTSVIVLTVWVEALEEKYLPSQQHSTEHLRQWPIYDSQCNPAAAFKGWPCWNSLFEGTCCGINWGEVQKGEIKDKALTIRASEAKALFALSLCSFLSILILSWKMFSYQSIHSLYGVTHLSGSMRMELMELYVLSCSHASRGL